MFENNLIKKFNNLDTPFYYYDLDILDNNIKRIKQQSDKYGFIIHYALKANANTEILKLIKKYGFGADCVSGNEVKKSVKTGFNSNKIVFAGVGKSDKEINYSLDNDIFSFNCESIQELEIINELAAKKNKIADIAIRINPNVNAKTHHYITTGLEENKFGINQWELETVIEKLKALNNIKLIGLHFHIGSQITDLNVFKSLCIRVNEVKNWFLKRRIIFEHINVGGGLGIDYEKPDDYQNPDFEAFFKLFDRFIELAPNQKLHFELGRAVVGQCGSLISRVLYIKNGINTNFAIIDGGMTELIRPALYQSFHKIENISSDKGIEFYDVVGPICESSDTFGKTVKLPITKRGDLIALRSVGAYGQVLSSNYNLRDTAKHYYSKDL